MVMKIKLAYFGTPDFSARFLEKLLTDVSINQLIDAKLVVTQPDRPVGRKQILTPSPVKLMANKYGIRVYDGEIRNWKLVPSEVEGLEIRNFDLALLFAFGEIIPKQLLSLPKHGFFNIHPSLLPKYRGASPIAYPLILGDKKTGVTIIKMDEKLDHGSIIAQEELPILPTDRRPDLEIKLTDLGFALFKKTVFNKDSLQIKPQNHQQATYTRLLKKSDGFIPFEVLKKALKNQIGAQFSPKIIADYKQKNPNSLITNYELPITIFNLFRGLHPWPGLWTLIEPARLNKMTPRKNRVGLMKKRLKIIDLDLVENKLIIKKVQLEGKKEVDFQTFNRNYQLFQ